MCQSLHRIVPGDAVGTDRRLQTRADTERALFVAVALAVAQTALSNTCATQIQQSAAVGMMLRNLLIQFTTSTFFISSVIDIQSSKCTVLITVGLLAGQQTVWVFTWTHECIPVEWKSMHCKNTLNSLYVT